MPSAIVCNMAGWPALKSGLKELLERRHFEKA
jgi:hypothetical protein